MTLSANVDEYVDCLVDDLVFNACASFKVNETDQKDVQIIPLRIRTPDPKIEVRRTSSEK